MGAPTGIVFNGGSGFNVSANGKSGASVFIFATEDGTIAGWNPGVDPTNAIIAVDNSSNPSAASGAVYKGLAILNNSSGSFLLAANFRAGTVDVFDKNFVAQHLAGSFTDPTLPAGFAPFDIKVIGNNVVVTYAQQNASKHDDVGGAGNGFINVFDLNGNLVRRFASQGTLDSPWGIALAPAQFGQFSNDLLVGNFGDGHISAFDPNNGAFLGQLTDASNNPIVIPGLWALTFGNGGNAGNSNTLFFTAGIQDEQHGLFGNLQPAAVKSAQPPIIVTGAGEGGGPQVSVFDAKSGALKTAFMAYDTAFHGGVRVAVGDINGDGVPDIVTAPGPSGGPDIRVFDGKTGAMIQEIQAFDPGFVGGEFVAVGEFDGDNHADIVVGADAGGGPEIRVFSGLDGHAIASFFAYDPAFPGGARVAVGDVNGDGHDDIITGAGPGGGPHVKVFDGTNLNNMLGSFMAFGTTFHGGVYVAAGNLGGKANADIVVGSGSGTSPMVNVFNGINDSLLQSFAPYAAQFLGGVRVGVVPDLNADGKADILTAAGPSGGPHVQAFDSATQAVLDSFFAYDSRFPGGVFVGGQ